MDFETQAIDYWKSKTDTANAHATEMYRAMDKAKSQMLKAPLTNRVIKALGILGEAMAKHDRYEPPKNQLPHHHNQKTDANSLGDTKSM